MHLDRGVEPGHTISRLTIDWLPVVATKPANFREWEKVISIAMSSRGKVVMRYDGARWTIGSASRRADQASLMAKGLEDMRDAVSDELQAAWVILDLSGKL
jgi:hypothetical protein